MLCTRKELKSLCLLAVGSPPEVIAPLQDLTKTAPEDVVLECGINPGDPKADITWFRKDRQVGGAQGGGQSTGVYHVKTGAIPENREMKKMKFSFFCQRHALWTSFVLFCSQL